MASQKVVILQNQVDIDGRSKVITEIISLLNEMDIIPDLISFSNNPERFQKAFGKEIKFNFKHIPFLFISGCLLQVVLLNFICRGKLKNYDLVINSNDNLYFLPDNLKYLHYIYDPIEGEFYYNRKLSLLSFKRYYSLLVETLCKTQKITINTKNSIFIVISNFTCKKLLKYYPDVTNKVNIIYPPAVDEKEISDGYEDKLYDIMTMGTFSPHKNQLQQLKIAKRLKNLKFAIVGSVWSRSYFEKCRNFIQGEDISNVSLFPDAQYSETRDLFKNSKIFLHTKIDEGFGITTVEAIACGCIPIVHNSGGQKEVVPMEELRFRDEDELVEKIDQILKMGKSVIYNYRNYLQNNIKKFSVKTFRENIREAILELLMRP